MKENKKRTLIIGAGEAGKMVAKEILDAKAISDSHQLLGFLDDDNNKNSYFGIPVLGKISEAETIIEKLSVDNVIIAIPSASRELISRVLIQLAPLKGIELRIVPGIYEIIQGDVEWKQIRPVEPQDLLGREEVAFKVDELLPFYQNKKVFITGAGGSIGSEILKQLFRLPVEKVFGMGRGENSIHQVLLTNPDEPRLEYIIGNIRDYRKVLFEINNKNPDLVFHAAAHKHVPLMEEYPEEAVKNNIIGTYNVARACFEAGVKDFVLVSTDKAVNPTSIMGATKKIAEKIILGLNKNKKTRYRCTRFGNVLGSRGSVIPTFLKQIQKGGPITITHPEIERYFMSIPEAARLVIQSASLEQGSIFVLDMGEPVKILELAKNLIRLTGHKEDEIPITYTGLRKGEKIFEELFGSDEPLVPTRFDKITAANREEPSFDPASIPGIISNFQEAADKVDRSEIKRLIQHYLPEFQS